MKTYIENSGSRFAEESEIKRMAVEMDCAGDTINAAGMPLISDGKTVSVANHDLHTVTFGATGSKKTRSLMKPLLILLAKAGESFLVHDPKGELYKKTKPLLDKLGYPVHVLNFRDPATGSRYNPLSTAFAAYKNGNKEKSNAYLSEIAQTIYAGLSANCNDVFWTATAERFWIGLAQLLRDEVDESAFTMENIRLLEAQGMERFATSRYLNEYCRMMQHNAEMVANLNPTIQAPSETQGGLLSVWSSPLGLYMQESLCDMMLESDFDFADMGRQKTAIFLVTPDEKSTYNAIISLLVKTAYSELIDLAESRECDGALPTRVNFVLDEFSNLPLIPDFGNMISAARSRNIRLNLVVQSLTQLHKTYSEATAENIIANCEAWYILRSNDIVLHERVSRMCGQHISEYMHTQRPLIDTMTIQRLDKQRGQVLIKLAGQYPFITELPDIDQYTFNLPDATNVDIPRRKPKIRPKFDIQEVTKNRKKNKLFDSLHAASQKESASASDTTPF